MVDLAKDGELVEVGLPFGLRFGLEIVTMATHQREQAAVLACDRIDVLPTG